MSFCHFLMCSLQMREQSTIKVILSILSVFLFCFLSLSKSICTISKSSKFGTEEWNKNRFITDTDDIRLSVFLLKEAAKVLFDQFDLLAHINTQDARNKGELRKWAEWKLDFLISSCNTTQQWPLVDNNNPFLQHLKNGFYDHYVPGSHHHCYLNFPWQFTKFTERFLCVTLVLS